ncbi:hypothetical protein E3N88_36410 [Mikania micrantha]|uniref:Tetraspanin n=1 Tax=Mikania micrantha TaxID=192012 RepID=A0A5N6M3L6_9ASTR|nr:hypothetical protein E3N88_36410 [Mikania micrantha]
MRTCCRSYLAFNLKFLNLFQLFVGISIILYSAHMLNQWNKQLLDPSDANSTILNTVLVPDQVIRMKSADGMISGSTSPWFIYAFMGLGMMLCCISCTGYIAAEAISGCCLCIYTVLKFVFILMEVALILFIALDSNWERDLPLNPTGEIDRFQEFVQSDIEFCKWIGIAVIIVQASSLLLGLVLRAMVNSQMKLDEDDTEEDPWEPLVNPHLAQTSVSVNVNGKSFHSDAWSSRMRERYGLSSGNVK